MPSRRPARTTPSRRWATVWPVPRRATRRREEVSEEPNPSGTLAATPDGSIGGWVTTDGRPHVVEDGGSQEWDMSVVDEAGSIAALVSDRGTCLEGSDGSGCVAFANSAEGTSARYTTSHGIVDTVPWVLAVGDASA